MEKGFSTAINAGSGLLGGLLGFAQQSAQNQFNADEAQKARSFEERMSSTAYQRAVADMQKAGLNPALMYGNGAAASTPAGNPASSAGFNAVADALAVQRQAAEIKNIEAQTNMTNAQSEKVVRENSWIDRLNQNVLDETASRLRLNDANIVAQDYKNGLTIAQTNEVLKNTEWIDRINSAETQAARAKAAYDFAEAAISQAEKAAGHRMSSSELLAVVDSITAALGESTPAGAVEGITDAAEQFLDDVKADPVNTIVDAGLAGPGGRALRDLWNKGNALGRKVDDAVAGFVRHIRGKSRRH